MNSRSWDSSSSSSSNSSDSCSHASVSSHSDSRLTVADILSSMANGEVITPTTARVGRLWSEGRGGGGKEMITGPFLDLMDGIGHLDGFVLETDDLEEQREILQKEIGDLKSQKEQLQFVLQAHRCIYKNNNNNKLNNNNINNAKSSPVSLPSRPTSLHLAPNSTSLRLNTSVDITGVPISTPSNGMFNFDALMDGGTGLTPISSGLTPIISTCSSQQRNCNVDMGSPESLNPPKLVSL
uniref:Uncharacterized protein n=1 Tax=Strigamia maritima TaxID=126957 RepID=T1JAH7_STRMM